MIAHREFDFENERAAEGPAQRCCIDTRIVESPARHENRCRRSPTAGFHSAAAGRPRRGRRHLREMDSA
jgi:hypothetical protein